MPETKHADPSALGLFGLAMATLVASSEKLGITSEYPYALPWVIFLGCIAQLIAGFYDYKKQNVFGATAFISFGLFWAGVSMTWFISTGAFGSILLTKGDIEQLGFAFVGYLIFSLYMTIGAVETNKALFAIFCLIDLLFIGLVMNAFNIMPHFGKTLAAYSELGISLLSFYASAANVLNIHFNKVFLPVGKPFGIFK